MKALGRVLLVLFVLSALAAGAAGWWAWSGHQRFADSPLAGVEAGDNLVVERGDTLRATYTLGGRNITYDFTINSVVNPFTMPELKEFECPQSVD